MEDNIEQIAQRQKKKQTRLMILGIAILVIGLVGITYAFFNYTRTGTANTIRVGSISFNSNQTETVNLTNVFPIDSSDVDTDTTNVDEAVITITGNTTYTEGIEYLITATDVVNTVGSGANEKTIPISVQVTATSGLGLADASYYDNRGDDSSIYKVLASDSIEDDGRLVVGYITNGVDGINGTITIKAYLDKDKIAISDTYDASNPGTDNMGTTSEWVDDRTVLTTTEWNTLQTNGVSFKVKVEANEGVWVEAPIAPIPTIDSCPGCKFMFSTNTYYYSDNNFYNQPRSSIATIENNHDTLVDDYTLLNKNYFMGLKIENNIISKAYICGIKKESPNQNVAFCLEGTTDGSAFSSNRAILNDNTAGMWQGTCDDDGEGSVECDGIVSAYAYNYGNVDVDDDVTGNCYISGLGDMKCDIY